MSQPSALSTSTTSSTFSSSSSAQPSFLIVGAGVFGASTALTLARLGYRSITVLDRSADGFVAPDAASHDINKIIRADYSDDHYRSLAKQSISQWRTDPVISRFYHEVGLVLHSGRRASPAITADADAYVRKGVDNAARTLSSDHSETPRPGHQLPRTAWVFASDQEAVQAFPQALRQSLGRGLKGFGKQQTGYVNPRGGWAEANNAVRAYMAEAVRLGVKVVPNSLVTELLYDTAASSSSSSGKKLVRGVKIADGQEFTADHTVLAAGAWSRLLLQQLLPGSSVNDVPPASPSVQCVVTLQLTPDECRLLKEAPVVLNFDTGLYVFEPNADGVLKLAIHSAAGYRNPAPRLDLETAYPTFKQGEQSSISQPSAIYKESADEYIPHDKVDQMLAELYTLYPHLRSVGKERIHSRICWYSDSLDENWIIDHHPDVAGGLVVAGGDSGHGYKFLPTLGRLIAARLGVVKEVPPLSEHQKRVFSFEHHRQLAEKVQKGERVESADSGRAPGAGVGGEPVAVRVAKLDTSQNPRARL